MSNKLEPQAASLGTSYTNRSWDPDFQLVRGDRGKGLSANAL